MGFFRSNYDNIYKLKEDVDIKKAVLFVAIIIILVVLISIIIYYTLNTRKLIKRKELFENQIEDYMKIRQQEIEEQERKKSEEKKIPVLTDNSKEQMKHIYSSETKRAFLTFDDGPSSNTEDILNILRERNINASFFMLGSQVERMPDIVKRVYNEGHYIANHGYSHIYSSIYSNPAEVINEYQRTNELVKNALQIPEYNTYIFRFPGGSIGGKYAEIKNQAIGLLEENNILYVDWNALTGDSEKQEPTEEYLMNNLQTTVQEKNSVVILMHDSQNKRVTVDFLPKAIDYLSEQGYNFVNFYEIMK